MTEAAARHVSRYLSRRGKGVGVRLGVKTTGCSGLAYKLEYVDEVAPEAEAAHAEPFETCHFCAHRERYSAASRLSSPASTIRS